MALPDDFPGDILTEAQVRAVEEARAYVVSAEEGRRGQGRAPLRDGACGREGPPGSRTPLLLVRSPEAKTGAV